jgi:hypothetical protein
VGIARRKPVNSGLQQLLDDWLMDK